VLVFCLSGASCPRQFRAPSTVTAPVVLFGEPSLEQVIEVINGNTERIRQLQTTDATLAAAGVPALKASLALERPRRLRIQAGSGLTGTELDLGSNDHVFWLWTKRNDPPAVYYAYHHQYSPTAMGDILPIPPHWLIESLGLIELDPAAHYQGPTRLGNGQLELRYTVGVDQGGLTKVLVLDDQRGHVLRQQVYDQQGRLIASATASAFQFDPVNLASLPRRVEIQLPPAQMSFTLQVEHFVINQLYADPAQLWAMPRFERAPPVNLAEPQVAPYQVGVTQPVVRQQSRLRGTAWRRLIGDFWRQ